MLKDYATNGAEWASDALSIQPCELWEEIKGHTVWLVGDSVTQVNLQLDEPASWKLTSLNITRQKLANLQKPSRACVILECL